MNLAEPASGRGKWTGQRRSHLLFLETSFYYYFDSFWWIRTALLHAQYFNRLKRWNLKSSHDYRIEIRYWKGQTGERPSPRSPPPPRPPRPPHSPHPPRPEKEYKYISTSLQLATALHESLWIIRSDNLPLIAKLCCANSNIKTKSCGSPFAVLDCPASAQSHRAFYKTW